MELRLICRQDLRFYHLFSQFSTLHLSEQHLPFNQFSWLISSFSHHLFYLGLSYGLVLEQSEPSRIQSFASLQFTIAHQCTDLVTNYPSLLQVLKSQNSFDQIRWVDQNWLFVPHSLFLFISSQFMSISSCICLINWTEIPATIH